MQAHLDRADVTGRPPHAKSERFRRRTGLRAVRHGRNRRIQLHDALSSIRGREFGWRAEPVPGIGSVILASEFLDALVAFPIRLPKFPGPSSNEFAQRVQANRCFLRWEQDPTEARTP